MATDRVQRRERDAKLRVQAVLADDSSAGPGEQRLGQQHDRPSHLPHRREDPARQLQQGHRSVSFYIPRSYVLNAYRQTDFRLSILFSS